MNILYFHSNNIDANTGGISRITDVMAQTFIKKGHQVYYLAVEELTPPSQIPEQFYLPDRKIIYTKRNLEYLKSFCKERNIDVIINQSALTTSFGRLMCEVPKVKCISVLHSSLFVPYRHVAYLLEHDLGKKKLGFIVPMLKLGLVNKIAVWHFARKRKALYKAMVAYCDAAVVLCQGQVDDFRLVLNGEEMRKLHIIHNCIEPCSDTPKNDVRKKQVLWVGTPDFRIKRTDLMLSIWNKAVQGHPDWQLMILGDSKYLEEVKRFASKKHVPQVDFVGRVNPEPYYKESQIVCVTSTHECFCMVLLESLKYGLVPMAFDSFPAAHEVINNGKTGVLVPAFNINKYAKALQSLMDNETYRRSLMENAFGSAKQFDSDRIADQWLKLIGKIQK